MILRWQNSLVSLKSINFLYILYSLYFYCYYYSNCVNIVVFFNLLILYQGPTMMCRLLIFPFMWHNVCLCYDIWWLSGVYLCFVEYDLVLFSIHPLSRMRILPINECGSQLLKDGSKSWMRQLTESYEVIITLVFLGNENVEHVGPIVDIEFEY